MLRTAVRLGGSLWRPSPVRRCGYKLSVKDIQELRFRTEAPMVDCKKALEESAGDFEKAMAWLRQKGKTVAEKKHGRVTEQGMLAACCGPHGAVVLQVCCETDFSGRNERFLSACDAVRRNTLTLMDATAGNLLLRPADDILAEVTARTRDELDACIAVIKENVTVKAAFVLPTPPAVPGEKPAVARVFGRYAHNSLHSFYDVGSIVGIVGLQVHDSGSPLLMPETAREVDDLAQHMVATMASNQGLTHQPFLGGEQTAGQWMKARGASLHSGLVVKFGEPPVVHLPPTRQAPKQK